MPQQDRSPDRPPRRREPAGRTPRTARGQAPVWIRMAGAGLELAFITIVFGAIGAAIDRQLQAARPVCSAIGGLLGFTLGMIRFIRLATSTSNLQRQIETSGSAAQAPGRVNEQPPGEQPPGDAVAADDDGGGDDRADETP
ncbi:Putative F0F1-ATPase subunit (ATPase_gene1) [Stieleria maiorica]|uniref:F0F1-ATPase subunit (ATPase_gene1) n=1 Tax=Stieleria maiorica TaxID=2795974 RepID=A0A5B9MAS4_9BACT|nr:AtpZ/AtpI family protein [Stieleria maiorica]QEF97326.1 Putative F0F1-ATPase subunit (ATPase_gene1) [Stieleria maiorica]